MLLTSGPNPKRPASVSKPLPNLIGYALGLAAFVAGLQTGVSFFLASLLALLVTGLAIAGHDIAVLRVHERASAGLRVLRPHNPFRVLTKLVGLTTTLLLLLWVSYLLVPMIGTSASTILTFYPVVLALILIAAPAYVLWVDRRMDEPEDGTHEIGCLVLGKWKGRNWHAVRHHLLGWIIKAYFLPLMFGGLLIVAAGLERAFHSPPETFVDMIFAGLKLLLFVDLMVAVLGYTLTLRVLDTHIRSCNPLLWGWVVTIGCYAPFWGFVAPHLAARSDGMGWNDWFAADPILLAVSGIGVLLLRAGWVYSNCCFGIRFSNLTHRGILTEGAFRWTKHPSYVTKNIGYWVAGMPFLSVLGWEAALTACLAMFGIGIIYFLRARAEERHLSQDPTYVEYALWINEHGLFAPLGRIFPWLRFVPPDRAPAPSVGPARAAGVTTG